MMRNIIVIMAIVLLASCKATLFDALPGTPQTKFPEQLQGEYYLTMPKQWFKKRTDTDTLFFYVLAVGFSLKDSNNIQETMLDSSHQLRLLQQKYYVMAMENEEHKGNWELSFLERSAKGLRIYSVLDGEKNGLQKYFKRKFIEINNSGDSLFVYRTNDVSLVNYYQKVLKKKETLELVRLKK